MEGPKPPRLLDQVRHQNRRKHMSRATEEANIQCIKPFTLFHDKKYPKELGAREVEDYLTYLVVKRRVAASTENQATSAIQSLYRRVFETGLLWLGNLERARKPRRVTTVPTRDEVDHLLSQLEGNVCLVRNLWHTSGLSLMDALRFSVKDLDLNHR